VRKDKSTPGMLTGYISLDTEMATGRNRLATLTGDDTFQFTFSVPVPKFNPPQYQRPEKLEPSSNNSTPDSSSSQLLFSLIPESHDGDGSDESDVGEEEKDNVKYRSSHQKQSDKESAEGGSTANNQDHSSKGKSEKVVVRKLRTRSVIVTGDSSPQAAQSSTRGLTAKSKSIERKRKRETNDENNHHSKHQSDEHNTYTATKDEDKVNLIFFMRDACCILVLSLSSRCHCRRLGDHGGRIMLLKRTNQA
jgi:hypothetical protein